jgi:K+-transporting ATPase ATPase A chain
MIFILQWMFLNGLVLIASYFLANYFVYLYRFDECVFSYQKNIENRFFNWTGLYRGPMDWLTYLKSLLKFELLAFLATYIHARIQSFREPHFKPDEAFQFAASFVTNTNWQSIAGEQAWGNPIWICGVIFNNFQSAAVGLCVLVVFCRAFIRKKFEGIGNFWLDLWRTFAYLLLPLSFVFSLLLASQGVPLNFKQNVVIPQYDTAVSLKQNIPMGPYAAHIPIKLLGTNGGSFTQANGANPIENPTAFTQFLSLFMMLLLPSFACFLFGHLTGNKRVGFAVWATMFTLASIFIMSAYFLESSQMLAKEWRMGTEGAVLWNGIMTATATGANAGILDELQPLSTGAYLFLMNIGKSVYWG